MNQNEQLIEKFYSSFAARDPIGMIECYHPDVSFQDEVFTLRGKAVGAMWHMLIEPEKKDKDTVLTYSDIQADETTGRAHWEARYTFSATGRKVHNILDATFRFQEGKIIEHRDRFDFWRWSRMALGPMGILLGWSPMVRNKVRATANERLERFIQEHPEYQ
jgi:ketosteroid isomerase-like protein